MKSLIERWKIWKKLKFCSDCKEPVIPVLGYWFHPDSDCNHQDGLMVTASEDETIIKLVDRGLQKRFTDKYGVEDITKHKKE